MRKEDIDAIKLATILELINELTHKAKLVGIVFANKEGELIVDNLQLEFNKESFTSMCASALESMSILSKLVGKDKANKIIAESPDNILLLIACGDSNFLIIILNDESKTDLLFSELNKLIKKCILLFE